MRLKTSLFLTMAIGITTDGAQVGAFTNPRLLFFLFLGLYLHLPSFCGDIITKHLVTLVLVGFKGFYYKQCSWLQWVHTSIKVVCTTS